MDYIPRHHSDYHSLLPCYHRDHVDWRRAQEIPSKRQNHNDAIHTGVHGHPDALLRWALVRQVCLPDFLQEVGTAQCYKSPTLVVDCVDGNNCQLLGLLHNVTVPLYACKFPSCDQSRMPNTGAELRGYGCQHRVGRNDGLPE